MRKYYKKYSEYYIENNKIIQSSKLFNTYYEFQIVEHIPYGSYLIWGISFVDGYLPLAELLPSDGHSLRPINPHTLKVIRVDDSKKILKLADEGINTLPKMEKYYEKYKNSQLTQKAERANLCKECIPIMKNIPDVENLYGK